MYVSPAFSLFAYHTHSGRSLHALPITQVALRFSLITLFCFQDHLMSATHLCIRRPDDFHVHLRDGKSMV